MLAPSRSQTYFLKERSKRCYLSAQYMAMAGRAAPARRDPGTSKGGALCSGGLRAVSGAGSAQAHCQDGAVDIPQTELGIGS